MIHNINELFLKNKQYHKNLLSNKSVRYTYKYKIIFFLLNLYRNLLIINYINKINNLIDYLGVLRKKILGNINLRKIIKRLRKLVYSLNSSLIDISDYNVTHVITLLTKYSFLYSTSFLDCIKSKYFKSFKLIGCSINHFLFLIYKESKDLLKYLKTITSRDFFLPINLKSLTQSFSNISILTLLERKVIYFNVFLFFNFKYHICFKSFNNKVPAYINFLESLKEYSINEFIVFFFFITKDFN